LTSKLPSIILLAIYVSHCIFSRITILSPHKILFTRDRSTTIVIIVGYKDSQFPQTIFPWTFCFIISVEIIICTLLETIKHNYGYHHF
jgi:hypothetical protein